MLTASYPTRAEPAQPPLFRCLLCFPAAKVPPSSLASAEAMKPQWQYGKPNQVGLMGHVGHGHVGFGWIWMDLGIRLYTVSIVIQP